MRTTCKETASALLYSVYTPTFLRTVPKRTASDQLLRAYSLRSVRYGTVPAIFEGTDVTITVEGRRHLGAAIGTSTFNQNYIKQKVSTWIREVEYLSSIATSQPHAAYAAFTHGQINKWTYLSRTIPDIEEFLKLQFDSNSCQPSQDRISKTWKET